MTRTVSPKLANVLAEGRKRNAERKAAEVAPVVISEAYAAKLDAIVAEGFVKLDDDFFAKNKS